VLGSRASTQKPVRSPVLAAIWPYTPSGESWDQLPTGAAGGAIRPESQPVLALVGWSCYQNSSVICPGEYEPPSARFRKVLAPACWAAGFPSTHAPSVPASSASPLLHVIALPA
jgi:hypothetical protein